MKKILLCLCLAAALTLSLGGTVAFLTDSDSDHNMMTVGNVDIEQLEHERADTDKPFYDQTTDAEDEDGRDFNDDDGELTDFVQDKILLPDAAAEKTDGETYTQSETWWEEITAGQDKIVRVKNSSNTPIWARTVFAFELIQDGDAYSDELVYKHFNRLYAAAGGDANNDKWFETDELVEKVEGGVVEINGEQCQLYVFTYPYEIPQGTTEPSLLEIAFAGAVTQEQIKNVGDRYDVYVCTQAVQKEGMDSVYGDDATTDLAKAKAALDKAFKPVSSDNFPDWEEDDASGDGNGEGETGGETGN